MNTYVCMHTYGLSYTVHTYVPYVERHVNFFGYRYPDVPVASCVDHIIHISVSITPRGINCTPTVQTGFTIRGITPRSPLFLFYHRPLHFQNKMLLKILNLIGVSTLLIAVSYAIQTPPVKFATDLTQIDDFV